MTTEYLVECLKETLEELIGALGDDVRASSTSGVIHRAQEAIVENGGTLPAICVGEAE